MDQQQSSSINDDPVAAVEVNNNSSAHVAEYIPNRACIHSTTRWFQGGMFVIFVIALVISVKTQYTNLSSGFIWGGGLSFFSVLFVLVSYLAEPTYQRHPNPLIFWRTIADFIFIVRLLAEQFTRCLFFNCDPLCNAKSYQCGCYKSGGSSELCIAYAGIIEFALIAAECWFVCMSLNLYFSLSNPFTDFKRNMKMFHLFCWGSGLFMAVLLTSMTDLAGFSYLGFCWTNALQSVPKADPDTCTSGDTVFDVLTASDGVLEANFTSWIFFYIWMALFLLFAVGVWIWAWQRLSEGMPETYVVRVQSINRTRFYVLAVTFYWVTVMVVYIYYLSNDAASERSSLSEFMNFLLACRGYVDLVVWFALNDFQIPRLSKLRRHEASPEALDVDLSPQVNAALRREVLFYTTSGIIQAVQAAERLPPSQRVQHLALLPKATPELVSNDDDAVFDASMRVSRRAQRTKTFHDYEPHAFRRIRERFGVDNQRYLTSLSTTARERLSEGASGAFMFFSGDSGLIVKSTSKEESKFLRSIASQYADYLCQHPDSLLTRFYGCHCLELYGKRFSFIVMANLFDTDQVIHSRYDIKGSWINRNADLPQTGKKVTCRHCNRKYYYQSTSYDDFNCPLRLGGHEPNVVLKDNDLTQKLRLHQEDAISLYRQLKMDSDLLYRFGIMDYSLLMGVHDVEYVVGGEFEERGVPKGAAGADKAALPLEKQFNPFDAAFVMDAAPSKAISDKKTVPYKATSLNDDVLSDSPASLPPSRRGSAGSQRKLPRGGMRLANSVVGPAYYHVGIIDILQTWTFKKQAERFVKIHLKRVDGDGLSAIEPQVYKERFQAKIRDILGIELDHHEERCSEHPFLQQTTHMDIEPTTSQNPIHLVRSLTSSNHLITSMEYQQRTSSSRSSSSNTHQTQQQTGQA